MSEHREGLGDEVSERPGDREREHEPVVIRDKRKIGRDATAAPEASAERDGLTEAEAEVPKAQALLLEERTADLQRLQAEFANYRKRVDRDRVLTREQGAGEVLASLLPVLDDIDRARAHGDLTGGLKSVADQLESVLAKHGLQRFGEVGDPFDPTIHEAVMHDLSDEVTQPTCTTVLRAGYKQGDRLLRAAMVGVTDPLTEPAAGDEEPTELAASEDPVAE